MGADIHLQVEQKINGKWQHVPWLPMERCRFCDGTGHRKEVNWDPDREKKVRIDTIFFKENCTLCEGRGSRLYHSRSYDTFAILANVRNGAGFAGVKTGDGFVPIHEPKGLPRDMDPATGAEEGSDDEKIPWLGDHSHSWLTVRELLEYDWDQTTHSEGVVAPSEYLVYKERGAPSSWSGGVSGPSVRHVTIPEMERIIKSKPEVVKAQDNLGFASKGGESYFTTVRWEVTYWEAAHTFYVESIPVLRKLARKVGNTNDVRIVFGFDS